MRDFIARLTAPRCRRTFVPVDPGCVVREHSRHSAAIVLGPQSSFFPSMSFLLTVEWRASAAQLHSEQGRAMLEGRGHSR